MLRDPHADHQAEAATAADRSLSRDRESSYVTLTLGDQLCGVPVLRIREVVTDARIVRVPLAPAQIAGNINLRGRIVTAIDTRYLLGLPPQEAGSRRVAAVAERGADLYALLIDQVLEVLTLPDADLEPLPINLSAEWRKHSSGVFRLPDRLLMLLDIESLLAMPALAA
ncbi:chemotaxis protein CheW [Rhizosaccharibacter radicis]|uniref:Chemotaxis protein CheW n=1 Tax=Rhizosaccharibacter radicis TaxID=2782605 RepID=A0ABT1VXM6_9PROT|nr:chemotaxis protein CheW [Acetobacteraceae bacterium KSS12]